MLDPTAQQQKAYDDFFSEPNQPTTASHPDFSGASFAPIGPPVGSNRTGGTSGVRTTTTNTTGNDYGSSAPASNAPLPFWKRIFWLFTLETYQPYFNIDSDDVQHRLVGSVKYINVDDGFWNLVLAGKSSNGGSSPEEELPHPGQQRQMMDNRQSISAGQKGPDAYGPFWLSTTLIFLLAVTSNISNYLHQSRNVDYQEDFEYDVIILAHAVWVMYGFTFGVPFVLAVIFRVVLTGEGGASMSGLPTFAELMCLYGYSLVPFVVGFILSGLLPFNAVQWIVLLCATGASLFFVLRNMAGRIIGKSMSSAISQYSSASSQQLPQHEDDLEGGNPDVDLSSSQDQRIQMVHHQREKGTPILASVIGIHVVFCLILKLGFYHPYATGIPAKGG